MIIPTIKIIEMIIISGQFDGIEICVCLFFSSMVFDFLCASKIRIPSSPPAIAPPKPMTFTKSSRFRK